MPQKRMTGMENLLGGWFGVKRSQPRQLVGASSVQWLAITVDGDRIELRNIKEARAVAKSGYAEDEKISHIVSEQGCQNPQDQVFQIPNVILQAKDYQGNLTKEYGKR